MPPPGFVHAADGTTESGGQNKKKSGGRRLFSLQGDGKEKKAGDALGHVLLVVFPGFGLPKDEYTDLAERL